MVRTTTTTTTTTVNPTIPVMSNLVYPTSIRPGESATVAFTVTSTLGVSLDGTVTFLHQGGSGSRYRWDNFFSSDNCVAASASTINCSGAITFPSTAYTGPYKLAIIGFANANNAGIWFTKDAALTVV